MAVIDTFTVPLVVAMVTAAEVVAAAITLGCTCLRVSPTQPLHCIQQPRQMAVDVLYSASQSSRHCLDAHTECACAQCGQCAFHTRFTTVLGVGMAGLCVAGTMGDRMMCWI